MLSTISRRSVHDNASAENRWHQNATVQQKMLMPITKERTVFPISDLITFKLFRNSCHLRTLTTHSITASCLLNLKRHAWLFPATQSRRLSTHRPITRIANGESTTSGLQLHWVSSNSLAVFSLYRTCKVTENRN